MRPDLCGWRVDRCPQPPRKVNVGDEHLGVYITTPDWVCEVLSESTRSRDERDGVKGRAYHQAGVTHYWLVDTDRCQITVYHRREREFEPLLVAGRETSRPLPPFDAVEFVVQRVFLMAALTSELR